MWQFEPTARLKDFDRVSGLRQAWTDLLNAYYKENLRQALDEIKARGGSKDDLRVYNPSLSPIPANATPRNVTWSSLPTSFDEQFDTVREKYTFLDERQQYAGHITRIQDEYCEWVVIRNAANKITSVIFTSEPPEYYQFLFNHSTQSRELLVDLYREICNIPTITLNDLVGANGKYNWWNNYNNNFAVHMQQPNNTLGAQVNIVARASILRKTPAGAPIVDALGLIKCAGFGEASRQSDPSIGHAVNNLARENRTITIEDPLGLYMSSVDWAGWVTPDGSAANNYWKVLRGTQDADPNKSYIVRAVYSVPPEKGFTVSDIRISGEAIEFGSQVAAKVNVRVAVLVSDPLAVPPSRAILCTGEPFAPTGFVDAKAMAFNAHHFVEESAEGNDFKSSRVSL